MIDASDIIALRRLIAATAASADGYDAVADVAGDADRVAILRRLGTARRAVLGPLQRRARAATGHPGAAAETLSPTRQDPAPGGNIGIATLAAAEERLHHEYEDALRNTLTAETRRVVEIAFGGVREGHDNLSVIEHACAH